MSSAEQSDIVELAARIADGEVLDWTGQENRLDVSDSKLLAGLKTLEQLYQTLQRASADPVADHQLTNWGHLELGQSLGHGAFAVVYSAFDPVLKREVALKLNTRVGSRQQTEGWIQEARRLARVQHPNVLAVHGADIHAGLPGLWCDRIEGRTLADVRVDHELPFSRILDIADELVSAVRAVHRAGLVHGDIKPANIMLAADRRLVLMDFGASQHVPAGQSVPDKAGSPLVMAPERFDGAALTAAVDTYAIGVVLFFLLEGRYPFNAPSVEALQEQWRENIRPDFNQPAPKAFRQLIQALLASKPERRPDLSSVSELLSQIRSAPVRRRRRLSVAFVLLSLTAALTFSTSAWRSAEDSRQQAVAVNEFLTSVLATPRPTQLGPDLPITAVLDDATTRADEAFADQPEALADVLTSIGESYRQLRQFDQASPLLVRAIALHEAHGNAISAGFVRMQLAELHREQGELNQARRLNQETLSVLTGRDPNSIRVQLLSRLGLIRILIAESSFDQAQVAISEAFDLADAARLSGNASEWAQLSLEAGQLSLRLGQPLEAQPRLEAALDYYRTNQGERNSNTVAARVSLVEALVFSNQLDAAAAIARKNFQAVSEWLGPRNRIRLAASDTLANIFSGQGQPEQALELSRQTLSAFTEQEQITELGALHILTNQIGYLLESDQATEALALADRLVPVVNEVFGPEHPTTLTTRLNKADALLASGQPEAARALAAEMHAIVSERFSEGHLFALVAMYLEGGGLSQLGEYEQAEKLLQTSYQALLSQLGPSDPLTLKAGLLLARHLHDSNQLEASRELAEALLRLSVERLGPIHIRSVQLQRLVDNLTA